MAESAVAIEPALLTKTTVSSLVVPARLEATRSAAVLAMSAALLVMIGPAIRGQSRFFLGIPATAAACALAWAAAVRRGDGDRGLSWVYTLLTIAAAIGIVMSLPSWARSWYWIPFHAYPVAGLFVIALARAGDARVRRTAVLTLAAGGSILSIVTPLAAPHPSIDLWYWIEGTTGALMHGIHPYTVSGIDPSNGAWDFGSTPAVFPYMPAVILIAAPPTAILGDYRYALALWLPITIVLFRAAARRMRVSAEFTDAATLTLLLNPRTLLVTLNGQTDLFLVPVAAAALWCAASGWRVAEAIAFLMLPAIKQYSAAPALIYVALRRRWRAIAIGSAVAAATVLPFLLWNRAATLEGMLYLVREPIGFRGDSDSITALVWWMSGLTSPRWLGIVGQFAAGAVAAWLLRDRGIAGVFLASAISLLVCFLLATQAFVNYYAFAAALLVFAAAALAGERETA